VKVMHAAESGREEFLARFRREAKAIAALRHPNILTVYDYGEDEGVAYIVMEYVPGGSLKQRLTGEPMAWSDVAPLVIGVGRALEHAHSEGVIHRDVKPANVLLPSPDWPLLVDFGLAKLTDALGDITQPGASLGTPAYLSPEQAGGETIDQRADVYGLGVVLYESLTGEIPCQSKSPLETMLRRLHERPAPPRSLNPQIPPAVEDVVMRALERKPEARYASMEEMVRELTRASGTAERQSAGQATTTVIRAYPSREATTTGPRLLLVVAGVHLPVPEQEEVLIGRADPCLPSPPDVDLEPYGGGAAGVSRRHARLLKRAAGWFLEDLHSTNGTFLNEVRVEPQHPVPMCSGDHVRLGTLATVFLDK
jgi:serine/threonine protein kinase